MLKHNVNASVLPSGGDVADASVALLGRRTGGVVVTSDPDDLRGIDPGSTWSRADSRVFLGTTASVETLLRGLAL